MLNFKHISSKSQKHLTKMSLFIINFILITTLIPISILVKADNDPNVEKVIEFNHKKFKAGNFATNKNGELFIEYYSEDEGDKPDQRLFYGKTKDGRELFFNENETSSTQELDIDLDETIDISKHLNYFKIYNSKNLFVTIKNEPNKENQYLFSINSYDWSVELHKFNKNINTDHYLWNFNDFFNLNDRKYRFRYETVLLELTIDSSYIIAFLPKDNVKENMNGLSFIKKFKFKSFAEDAYEEIESIKYDNYINKTILSAFLMDDTFLVTVSMEEVEEEEGNYLSEFEAARLRNLQFPYFKFTLNFYHNDLDAFDLGDKNILNIKNFYYFNNGDLLFKTIYLKKGFTIFTWVLPNNFNIYISLSKFSFSSGVNVITQIHQTLYFYYIEEILSDFVKINDRKIVFICTNCILPKGSVRNSFSRRNQQIDNLLNILVIDIQPDYMGINEPSIYNLELDNYAPILQISGFFIMITYYLLQLLYHQKKAIILIMRI